MALRGTNQEFGRPYNRRIVLESIRLHGPIARGEIARRVGLTVQTVSTIVRELEDQDYILSLREEPKGRGLPPATLRINPEGGYAVGIHITPLGISAALINLSGDVIESIYREAPNATPDHAFELIGAMVVELTRLRAGGRVLGVGMALPGPFDVESMSFVGPTTMTGWKDVALRERLAASTGLPAFFETDMAAAAMGERLYGLGAQFSEYYYLYFGVGLGGVMVHDGSALRGAWGNAGEIGHIPVIPGGEACPCGNSGCLERYLSLEALRRWNGSEAEWVAEVAPIFHNAVAVIENLFDPETVILGGLASTDLLEMLAGSAAGLHNSVSARKDRTTPRVVVARGGQHSVLRGAAALAVSGVLSPRFGQMFAAERERERDLLKGREIAA
ncbi:ROK family transcriptional regulator [Mesorhizobium sp. M7A.F.Ca.CA.001.09.2.1]|uniref:ROK family transcriptional regulator n=3 Tax=Mesorhizobium TaxID=68287 RepID=A0AB38T795_9HYPH|nr:MULTISPECIES: ROK family transcriptional regulator [Mesorhizobium]RUY51169.1 ROK family transcriptional regulator [Mesorhizobium sp. M7A.F.Ca.CA.001.13.2.1]MDF3217721.1 ROK family transcriptional regulator [Mesorhizobium ciceri]RUY59616.1 ROK family transcriptional regulator [Mesorhizobium sp. M7A.F.Ca.CA.001.05.1.1]RUY70718.1 ROK family transcriptional regulator [Mesorhizobium sp. M7A.F.Ca.CA.001.13.1.1]RUY75984.1 ROK family transcriptional regulator [Mesorhizobium sp. M7A.F.Ca.CA.001.09.2